MRIQNKAFLLSLFDLTENVLTLMIFEGNGIERKSESNSTKIYDEILFLRARRANTKKKKYWLPAWCVCACVRACRAISEFTIDQNNHKGNQPFGWACVFVFVSVNVWRVQFEKKDFPFECNFVVRTQFKILSKSRYSLILNRTGPTKSDKRQKLRATAVFVVLTPFKCISFDTMFRHPPIEIVQCFCHLVTYCAIV